MTTLVLPYVEKDKSYEKLGWVLLFLSLGLGFLLFYGAFFNRKDYYNRKALYNYLKDNPLPTPRRFDKFTEWTINNICITLVEGRWYAYEKDNSMINFFCGDLIDKRRYKRILKKLQASSSNPNGGSQDLIVNLRADFSSLATLEKNVKKTFKNS